MTNEYDNPLVTRYASKEMAELWGPLRKFRTWRRLWVALAEAERELGLPAADGQTPRIRSEQIEELRKHVEDIDLPLAEAYEHRFHHDVMAHIHAFGDACPSARDIIHLGATSCYVTDNTDLLLMREGLRLLLGRLLEVIAALGDFARRSRAIPTVGFTHFQPAQLTTVGKRACLWCYDFVLDLEEMEHRLASLRFRGAKGTTGTQASFLSLFRGNHDSVRQLDLLVAQKMGFDEVYVVTGQTYSRKIDSQVLDCLSGICQSAHKYGTDLRLLAHLQEVEEPFGQEQVGSSAMPYKRNPMRAERMCSISRYGMNLAPNAAQTASTQWLERTLDDSANRRMALPQAFLAVDGVLALALEISKGLVVNAEVIARHVDEAVPFMATESILMAAVAAGADRQTLHEKIRQHSFEVTRQMKAGQFDNDLVARLQSDQAFQGLDMKELTRIDRFIGRAPQQVDEFIQLVISPLLDRHKDVRKTSFAVRL
jgi:adenylosuccinate lyase